MAVLERLKTFLSKKEKKEVYGKKRRIFFFKEGAFHQFPLPFSAFMIDNHPSVLNLTSKSKLQPDPGQIFPFSFPSKEQTVQSDKEVLNIKKHF